MYGWNSISKAGFRASMPRSIARELREQVRAEAEAGKQNNNNSNNHLQRVNSHPQSITTQGSTATTGQRDVLPKGCYCQLGSVFRAILFLVLILGVTGGVCYWIYLSHFSSSNKSSDPDPNRGKQSTEKPFTEEVEEVHEDLQITISELKKLYTEAKLLKLKAGNESQNETEFKIPENETETELETTPANETELETTENEAEMKKPVNETGISAEEAGVRARHGKALNMEMKFVQEGGTLADLAVSTDWLKKIPAAISANSSESLEEKVLKDPTLDVYTDVNGNLHSVSELNSLLASLKRQVQPEVLREEHLVEIVTPQMIDEDTTTATTTTTTTTTTAPSTTMTEDWVLEDRSKNGFSFDHFFTNKSTLTSTDVDARKLESETVVNTKEESSTGFQTDDGYVTDNGFRTDNGFETDKSIFNLIDVVKVQQNNIDLSTTISHEDEIDLNNFFPPNVTSSSEQDEVTLTSQDPQEVPEISTLDLSSQELDNQNLNSQELNNPELINHEHNSQELNNPELNNHELSNQELAVTSNRDIGIPEVGANNPEPQVFKITDLLREDRKQPEQSSIDQGVFSTTLNVREEDDVADVDVSLEASIQNNHEEDNPEPQNEEIRSLTDILKSLKQDSNFSFPSPETDQQPREEQESVQEMSEIDSGSLHSLFASLENKKSKDNFSPEIFSLEGIANHFVSTGIVIF